MNFPTNLAEKLPQGTPKNLARPFLYLIHVICFIFLLTFSYFFKEMKFKACPTKLPSKMSCVHGGKFLIGSDSTQWKDENPPHHVILSTYLIDKFEVTTSEYQKCVQKKDCQLVISNYKQMRGNDQPQLKLSWYQAREYCQKRNKRLPTEAEFEAASRGPKGETYPWGNERADCSKAVIFEKNKRGCTSAYGKQGNTDKVGSRRVGRYGLYDMAGNAHEWVNDWYEKSYEKCGKWCLGENPRGPCQGEDDCPSYTEKLVKGGSWYWDSTWARASKRRAYPPNNRPPHHFGFRCAKDI